MISVKLATISLLLISTIHAQFIPGTCGFFGFGCPKPKVVEAPPAPKPPVFVPIFERVLYKGILDPNSFEINDTFFATEATATALGKKFGGVVKSVVALSNPNGMYVYLEGPNAGKLAEHRLLVFPAGTPLIDADGSVAGLTKVEFEVNAGILADIYRRIPEDQFPAISYVYGDPPVKQFRLSLPEQHARSVIFNMYRDIYLAQKEKGALL